MKVSAIILAALLAVNAHDAAASDDPAKPVENRTSVNCDPGGSSRELGESRLFIPSLFPIAEAISYVSFEAGAYYGIISEVELEKGCPIAEVRKL